MAFLRGSLVRRSDGALSSYGSVYRAMAVFDEDFYESSKSVEVAALFDDDPNQMLSS